MASDGGDGSTVKTVHDLGLTEAFRALRRQWWLVLGVTIAVAAVAFGLSLIQEKTYTASATLYARIAPSVVLVNGPQRDIEGNKSIFVSPRPEPGRESVTGARLASLDEVSDRTAERIGGEVSGDEIKSKVEVKPLLNTDLFRIQVTDRSPEFAAKLANALAREYIEFRYEADVAKVKRAARLVERGLGASHEDRPSAQFLRSRRQQLGMLENITALQTGNLDLVETAKVPSSPSSPKPARNGVLGLALGLLLGIALGLARDRIQARPARTNGTEAMG